MRNGADDSMMAAAGVATTVASGVNAAASDIIDGHADALAQANSWFERILILLWIPFSVFVGFAMWRWGFPNYVCVFSGFVALFAWGFLVACAHTSAESDCSAGHGGYEYKDDYGLDEDEDY